MKTVTVTSIEYIFEGVRIRVEPADAGLKVGSTLTRDDGMNWSVREVLTQVAEPERGPIYALTPDEKNNPKKPIYTEDRLAVS